MRVRISWWDIHKIARAIGYPFRVIFERAGVFFLPDFEDDEADFVSGFHALVGALIANVAVAYGGFHWRSLLAAFTASFLWMLAFGLIDGLDAEEQRGTRQSDIGWCFFGVSLSILALALGHLLKAL